MFDYSNLNKNFIVIGANTAGLAAANQIRRIRHDAQITVLEAGEYISYGSCGLPYFISGIVENIQDLLVYSKDYFEKNKNIKILLNHKVVGIDCSKKQLAVLVNNNCRQNNNSKDNIQNNKSTNFLNFSFDKLIICSGASPIKLEDTEGINSKNVFYFRNVYDALNLKNFLKSNTPQSAAIIGGGYIGLLLADAFYKLGIKVNIVEAKPKIYSDYEDEIIEILTNQVLKNNQKIFTNYKLKKFNCNKANNFAYSALLEHSLKPAELIELDSDIFIICTGIKPNTEFLKNSSIDIAKNGAIKTSSTCQTTQPSIFAAGDCCMVKNIITNSYEYIPTAQNALKMGRIAGANAAGQKEVFQGSLNTKIDKIFDLEIARTGLSLNTALEYKFDAVKITDQYLSHVKALGGAVKVNVSIVVDKKTRKILGAQMIGSQGVSKRIDVFSTAVLAGLTVDNIYQLDLSYSPFASTLPDLINKICGKASLLLNKAKF